MLKPIVRGAVCGGIVFSVFLLAASVVVLKLGIPGNIYIAVMYAVICLSAFAGGFAAVRQGREKGIILGVMSALPLTACVVSLSAALGGFGTMLVTAVGMMLLAGAVGGISAANMRSRRKR